MHNEAQIRVLVENWARAIEEQDYAGVLANHAGNIVMFDVPFPIQLKGIEAYKESWGPFFAAQQKGLFKLNELEITAGEDVAFCHSIVTCGIELENSFEVRLTIGLEKIDGSWMITHEHHSVPAV